MASLALPSPLLAVTQIVTLTHINPHVLKSSREEWVRNPRRTNEAHPSSASQYRFGFGAFEGEAGGSHLVAQQTTCPRREKIAAGR
jgi:hypothetical protein